MAISKTRWLIRCALGLMMLAVGALALQTWRVRQPAYLWREATAARQNGDLAAANLYLKNYLRAEPDDPRGHRALAELCLEQSTVEGESPTYADSPAALAHLAQAAALVPDDLVLHRTLMKAHFTRGDLREAARAAGQVAELDENDPDANYLLAWLAMEQKDYENAEDRLPKLLSIEPPRFRTLNLAVHLAEATGNADELRGSLEAVLETAARLDASDVSKLTDSERNDMLVLMSVAIRRATTLPEACLRAEKALTILERLSDSRLIGGDKSPTRWLAETGAELADWLVDRWSSETPLDRQGELQALLQHVDRLARRAISARQATAQLFGFVARRCFQRGRFDEAMHFIDQGIAESVDRTDSSKHAVLSLHRLAARHALVQHRLKRAAKHADALLADPQFAGWGHLTAGLIASQEGRIERSLEHVLEARRRLGESFLVRVCLAKSYLALGRFGDAMAHLESFHEGFEHLKERERALLTYYLGGIDAVRLALARVHLSKDQWDEALPFLQALQGVPLEPRALESVFAFHWAAGRPAAALSVLRSARQRFPDDVALLWTELGVLLDAGRTEDADKLVEHFAAVRPESRSARLALVKWKASLGNYDEAIDRLNQLQSRYPNDALLKLTRVQLLLRTGNVDALASLDEPWRGDSATEAIAELVQVEVALARRDLEETSRLLAELRSKGHCGGAVPLWQGKVAAANGDYRQSIELLSEAMEFTAVRSAARGPLWGSLLALAREHGPGHVEPIARRLLESFPHEPILILAQAEMQTLQGHIGPAIATLRQLGTASDRAALAAYGNARVWARVHRYDLALKELERGLRIEPRQSSLQLMAAQMSLAAEQHVKTLEYTQKLLRKHPRHWQAYVLQARALSGLSRNDEAIQTLRAIITHRPALASVYASLADLHLQDRDFDAALQVIQGARTLLPHDMSLIGRQIAVLCDTGRVEEARDLAEQTATDADKNSVPLQLSVAFHRCGQQDLARVWAQQALQAATAAQQPAVHLVMAEICRSEYQANGDAARLSEACQHYEAVLLKQPLHVMAANNLAWILATEFGKAEQAVSVAERIVHATSAECLPAELVDTLVTIYRRTDRMQAAYETLAQARRGRLEDPRLDFHLGMVYAATDRPRLARGALVRALRSGLRPQQAQEALDQLQALPSDRSGS